MIGAIERGQVPVTNLRSAMLVRRRKDWKLGMERMQNVIPMETLVSLLITELNLDMIALRSREYRDKSQKRTARICRVYALDGTAQQVNGASFHRTARELKITTPSSISE